MRAIKFQFGIAKVSCLVDYFPDAAAYYLQVFPCNKCIKTKKSGAGEKKEKKREEIYQEIGKKKYSPHLPQQKNVSLREFPLNKTRVKAPP